MNPSRRAFLQATAAASSPASSPLRLNRGVRVAMIGLDGHPGEIVGPLNDLPDVEIAAIAEPRGEIFNRFVEGKPRLARVRRYDTIAPMLEESRPDVVAVCNNNGERAAAILECTSRKLNFIAEKPYATSRQDLLRIKEAISASGVRAGMLLPMRYDSPYLALRQIVQSGAIGEVIQISAQKSYVLGKRDDWFKKQATYGSTILWIGVHMIDLMMWAGLRRFTRASSFMGRVGLADTGEMETTASTSFALDNGGTASLHLDYCRPATAGGHGDDRLRLAGAKGVAEYMAATGVTLMTADRAPHQITALPPKGSVFRDYLAQVYLGVQPTLTLSEIYAVCEATLAAHEAAVLGRVVPIP